MTGFLHPSWSSRTSSPTIVGRAVLLIALASLFAGCAGAPPHEPTQPLPPIETPQLYSKVFIDTPGRPGHGDLVAILGEAAIGNPGEDVSLVRVYDRNLQTIGFFASGGATFRIETTRDGREIEEFLGNHDTAGSIEQICGVSGPFRLEKGL